MRLRSHVYWWVWSWQSVKISSWKIIFFKFLKFGLNFYSLDKHLKCVELWFGLKFWATRSAWGKNLLISSFWNPQNFLTIFLFGNIFEIIFVVILLSIFPQFPLIFSKKYNFSKFWRNFTKSHNFLRIFSFCSRFFL